MAKTQTFFTFRTNYFRIVKSLSPRISVWFTFRFAIICLMGVPNIFGHSSCRIPVYQTHFERGDGLVR